MNDARPLSLAEYLALRSQQGPGALDDHVEAWPMLAPYSLWAEIEHDMIASTFAPAQMHKLPSGTLN